MPRGERKRVMALAEVVRLQMKAGERKNGTIMEVRCYKSGGEGGNRVGVVVLEIQGLQVTEP